jgi:hypothetical protein
VNVKTCEMICTAYAKGGVHGFRFYEVSVGEKFLECVLVGGVWGVLGF